MWNSIPSPKSHLSIPDTASQGPWSQPLVGKAQPSLELQDGAQSPPQDKVLELLPPLCLTCLPTLAEVTGTLRLSAKHWHECIPDLSAPGHIPIDIHIKSYLIVVTRFGDFTNQLNFKNNFGNQPGGTKFLLSPRKNTGDQGKHPLLPSFQKRKVIMIPTKYGRT